MLHPDVTNHRDRLLSGGEQVDNSRPIKELEADLFAAELLMPKKRLVDCFEKSFGELINRDHLTADHALWLSAGCGTPLNEIDLANDSRRLALAVAGTRSYGVGKHFTPLKDKFGVSPTAMAIRLEELRLVV